MNLPPPHLARPSSETPRRGSRAALWTFLGWLGALLAARLVSVSGWALPPCALRAITGVPCPFCGSTRAAVAVAQGELGTAVQLNPLFGGLGLWILVWFGSWLIDRATGSQLEARLVRWSKRRTALWLLGTATAANWVYLCFYLPP
ncbi:MAG: DUF2752 domain-containing protein [Verrucomicrobia bacterium]|nr:DUF2752 domain-containing protein [Verrucomicrobiota bacterium]